MKFDLCKAIDNEEYARSIQINDNVCFDDYIFVFSAMYASNINFNLWIEVLQNNEKLLDLLLSSASAEHCLDWHEAIEDIMDLCDIKKVNITFKTNKIARDYINVNVSPVLLQRLHDNHKLSLNDVVDALKMVA